MDESSVTQAGGTVVKRPRVVVGSDSGGLLDPAIIQGTLELILRELRAHTVLMQAALLSTSTAQLGLDEVYSIASETRGD